jgi:isoquinoline 1-oxidoreductase alpha subunit
VGKNVMTIEGVSSTRVGRAVQAAWLAKEVVQCGYCQSGQIMSAAALLAEKDSPTDADIDTAMSGNVCRCGTYPRIREAIKEAAASLKRRGA